LNAYFIQKYKLKKNMSTKTEQILEDLKILTLIEVSDLVEKLEETFGIDASAVSAGVVMPGVPAAAPAEEAKTEFDVVLAEAPPADKKLGVLKIVRTLTGLGLKEAKDLVESAPKTIKEKVSKAETDTMKKELEEAGGKITLK
jgi:large subunit ribosomal protein L7/L12